MFAAYAALACVSALVYRKLPRDEQPSQKRERVPLGPFFTHLPSSLCLLALPFCGALHWAVALLLVRAALSQMDVPTRSSYVMAVVTPAERPAAASATSVPRSLAAALSPAIAGYMLTASTFGWPFVAAGALKIAYDLLLLAMFDDVKPPEEVKGSPRPEKGG